MSPAVSVAGLDLSYVQLVAALLPVLTSAGRIQMQHYRAGVAVATKADATPVTVADQDSERVILAALARIAPGVSVVAEEAMAGGAVPSPAQTFFLVDPLDGTREFIEGRGEFTVNIALVHDTRAVFGVVYAPVSGDLYVTLGERRAAHAVLAPALVQPALTTFDGQEIRARQGDRDNLTALVSRSHMTAETQAFMSRYRITQTKAAGSSLKFCLIAAGAADVYPRAGRTNEWDTAAGQAVLEAAGGSVLMFDGAPLRYGKVDQNYRNPDYVAWGAGLP